MAQTNKEGMAEELEALKLDTEVEELKNQISNNLKTIQAQRFQITDLERTFASYRASHPLDLNQVATLLRAIKTEGA